MDDEVERALHVWLLNRGIVITPFHNICSSRRTRRRRMPSRWRHEALAGFIAELRA